MAPFLDSIKSLYSELTNQRDPVNNNAFRGQALDVQTMREIYRTGLGNKIIRLKAGLALRDALQFESTADEEFYKRRLDRKVKEVTRWMLAFGRGVVVIHERGGNLMEPLPTNMADREYQLHVFSGDMVYIPAVTHDLTSLRYYRPLGYNVRAHTIHHSRVVDFTYIMPPELDMPEYRYGGISEFELVYRQLVNDGIVERASPAILEKNSTLFYKVKGFKNLLRQKKHKDMLAYFRTVENGRSIYGAGLLDHEDEVQTVEQALTNLADVDKITLRRLAMVTGIPLAWLVGESVQGLNATGDIENDTLRATIELLQNDYLIDPINELLTKLNLPEAWLRENQGETAKDRIEYETSAINNALGLQQMGEDFRAYLREKDIGEVDPVRTFFDERPGDDDEA